MIMAAITPIHTPESMEPIGPYSQAIKANGFIFVSPVTHYDAATKQMLQGTVAEKTHQLCKNAKAVLEAGGSSLEKVVKVVVYFTDFADFREFNDVYAEYFPQKPARSPVITKLPGGSTLAIELTAVE